MEDLGSDRPVLPSDLTPYFTDPISPEAFLAMASMYAQDADATPALNIEPGLFPCSTNINYNCLIT